MRLIDLARALGATLESTVPGAGEVEVCRVNTLEDADARSVSFLTNVKFVAKVAQTRAAAVLCDAKSLSVHGRAFPCPALVTENPYLAMARAVEILHPVARHQPGIHPLAFIHPEAELGVDVTVMALAYVGRARVGARTVIYPHAFLDDDVAVGEDGLVFPHVVLMRGTRVGARAVLQPGAVLGADGFGFASEASGAAHKIPQVGDVVVGDDVEIGACSCVDRSALGSTVLKDGVKLDNQVQVGHNVVLGENVVICGQSAVGGSARLGRNAMMGGCSGLANHGRLGDGARVAGASFVLGDVPAGQTVLGNPAFEVGQRMKAEGLFRNLESHLAQVAALHRRVATLEAKLGVVPVKEGEKT
jgi:UDP-3-O-[3-hydroxymyristoyl] glucosamine N-acyltransferase